MANFTSNTSDKRRLIALLLCTFGGFFGLHQFYVGRIGKGVLYIFTVGFFGFGVIIDWIKILLGSFRDNVGAPLRQW